MKLLLSFNLVIFFIFQGCIQQPQVNIKEQTFKKLEKIRQQKKALVLKYFKSRHHKSESVSKDYKLLKFFTAFQESNKSGEIDFEFNKYYVQEYGRLL